MSSKVLLVDGYGVKIRVKKNTLVVQSNGSSSVVPLYEIDRVVVVSSGVSITSSAVRKLAVYGVSIVFLGPRGEPVVSLEPPWLSSTTDTRLAQYRAYFSKNSRIDYAKSFVYAKLANQYEYLRVASLKTGEKWIADEAEEIKNLSRQLVLEVDEHRIRVVEASAARHYWQTIAYIVPDKYEFRGRDHDSADPVNISLNYLYGVLYSEVFRALVVHGLDPYLGFLHTLRSGSPSLVFDYSEMFKTSCVDSLVVELLVGEKISIEVEDTGFLSHNTRRRLIEKFYEWIRRRVATRKRETEQLRRYINLYARRLAQALRTSSSYEGFVEVYRL